MEICYEEHTLIKGFTLLRRASLLAPIRFVTLLG